MRKSASTGTLAGRLAQEVKGDTASLAAANGRSKMRRSGSNSTVAALKSARKAGLEQDLHRLGSQPLHLLQQCSLPAGPVRSTRCVATPALPHFDALSPPDLAEDVVLEVSFARGLAATECFELYGPMRAAPALAGGAAAAAGDAAAADVHWSGQAVTSQQLAACLATPFTGQDQNLGEMVRARVDRLAANQQLSTQLRYAEELRQRGYEEEQEEQEALQQEAGGQRRLRIRRRPSEEVLEAQLAGLGSGGVPILGGGRPKEPTPAAAHSPQTAAALQTLYASLDDDSNRLTLDEDMLLLKSRDELDEGTIFSLDAGSIKDETKQGRRGLYNISVQAAPELYGA